MSTSWGGMWGGAATSSVPTDRSAHGYAHHIGKGRVRVGGGVVADVAADVAAGTRSRIGCYWIGCYWIGSS